MALSRAMSSARAGLGAHNTAMDVVGNNIANINTPGFKGSRVTFSDSLYQTLSAASKGNSTTGKAGRNPMQIGYGATCSSIQMDTGSPGFTSTGYGTDCYINGEGYFIVATNYADSKPAGIEYTRVGQLQFDDDGYLTDGKNRILGSSAAASGSLPTTDPDTDKITTTTDPTSLGYVHYDTKDAKNVLSDVSIASDGTVTAKNTDGNVVTIGHIAVAHFNNPGGLKQLGNSYYDKTDNSGDPTCTVPGTNSTGALTTGALEASNVDLANEFSNMIVYERGFQANSKIISVSDEMLQTLVNMKG